MNCHLPGSKVCDVDLASLDKDQLEVGINVEMEHTTDRDIATEIAVGHLREDKDYYRKLIAVEKLTWDQLKRAIDLLNKDLSDDEKDIQAIDSLLPAPMLNM